MTNEPAVLTFGKHKGRSVEELLHDDPKYLEWLCAQEWFRTRFTILHQVIINHGPEQQDTPEHNKMQVLFLDDDYCKYLYYNFHPRADKEDRDLKIINRKFEHHGIDVAFQFSNSDICYIELKPTIGDDYPSVLRQIKKYKASRQSGGQFFLVIHEYSGQGATKNQFVKMMKEEEIIVVFSTDLQTTIKETAE